MLKAFLSYSTLDKKIAGEIKRCLEEHDVIECFVAHDDIEPGSEWEQEILKNLDSSDYFLTLQTSHFQDSYWCQQEVGFATANRAKIKIIPFIPDSGGVDPVGFCSKIQGFRLNCEDIEGSIKRWLISEGIIDHEQDEELEKRLMIFRASGSFEEAGRNSASLFELRIFFTRAIIRRIVEATLQNGQILYSWTARDYLKRLFVDNAKLISKEEMEAFFQAG